MGHSLAAPLLPVNSTTQGPKAWAQFRGRLVAPTAGEYFELRRVLATMTALLNMCVSTGPSGEVVDLILGLCEVINTSDVASKVDQGSISRHLHWDLAWHNDLDHANQDLTTEVPVISITSQRQTRDSIYFCGC